MTAAAGTINQWQESKSFMDAIPDEVRVSHERQICEGSAVWEQELQNAEKTGKVLFVHDHLYYTTSPDHVHASVIPPGSSIKEGSNFNLIPEKLLLNPGTVPLFTIRNPVLCVPSTIKSIRDTKTGGASLPAYNIGTNLGFARELHDWYKSNGIEPVVVDADDYMTSEHFSRRLAQRIGLDPGQVTVAWEPTPAEQQAQMHPVLRAIQKTLIDSKGLVPRRAAKNINLEEEEARWKDDFSQGAVDLIHELIQRMSPDYEYLYQRRFVVE